MQYICRVTKLATCRIFSTRCIGRNCYEQVLEDCTWLTDIIKLPSFIINTALAYMNKNVCNIFRNELITTNIFKSQTDPALVVIFLGAVIHQLVKCRQWPLCLCVWSTGRSRRRESAGALIDSRTTPTFFSGPVETSDHTRRALGLPAGRAMRRT